MKHILVLDDEVDVEFIFNAMLEDEIQCNKLKIDFHNNPTTCLECMKESGKVYDFIFTDINMPQINGVQFVNKLRRSGYEAPIAFISAYLKEDYELDMKTLDVSIFLSKPLKFDQIRDVLNL